jgi:hypothetical protein
MNEHKRCIFCSEYITATFFYFPNNMHISVIISMMQGLQDPNSEPCLSVGSLFCLPPNSNMNLSKLSLTDLVNFRDIQYECRTARDFSELK